MGRGTDARWLIATGLIIMAISCYWMAACMKIWLITPWQVCYPRMVLTAGSGFEFSSADQCNVAAFKYTPKHLRGAAVGLFALLRNEGGSIGTSLTQTIQERRWQFHTLRLGESLDPFNSIVTSYLSNAYKAYFTLAQSNGDAAALQPASPAVSFRTTGRCRRWPLSVFRCG